MTVYMAMNVAVWRTSEEPKHEPVMVDAGKDYYHIYYYAPASGNVYRSLSDMPDPYWHIMDKDLTRRVIEEDLNLETIEGAEFITDIGWVVYPTTEVRPVRSFANVK